jgi:ADP-heptose:LPS heptosyltransferase
MVRPEDPAGRLDAAFPIPQQGHEVERVLAFTSFLGAPVPLTGPELRLEAADAAAAESALAGAAEPLIGIHPGAREATKRWPASRFAKAAAALWQERGGTVVVVGGPDEIAAAAMIEAGLGSKCLNLAGRLSLPVTVAVVRRLSVLVTNDSAPAHIAYATGTPSVTIFGGTEAARWGPRPARRHRVLVHDVPCRPCQGDSCLLGFACLAAIRPSDAVEAVRQLNA